MEQAMGKNTKGMRDVVERYDVAYLYTIESTYGKLGKPCGT